MSLTCQGLVSQWPYWLSTDRLLSRSPRIRTLTFPAQLHHLRWLLNHLASMSCAISPPAYASYDIFVHQLADLRPASFRPSLAGWPLPFASSYRLITTWFSTVIFLQRTFTSLVNAHVGRTQEHSADCQKRRFFVLLAIARLSHKNPSLLATADVGVICKRESSERDIFRGMANRS